jgi:hypothetical protein
MLMMFDLTEDSEWSEKGSSSLIISMMEARDERSV